MQRFQVRAVARDGHMTRELARREPEGWEGRLVQLELCMNPATKYEKMSRHHENELSVR